MKTFNVKDFGNRTQKIEADRVTFHPGHVVFTTGSIFDSQIVKAIINSNVTEITEETQS